MTKHPLPFLIALLPIILTGCYLMPYPDHRLTHKASSWGKVKRGERYVLLRDFQPIPNTSALRDSSCPGVDDVGLIRKGTAIKFTGFCVRRNYWGALPFVYAEVLDGEYEGKTFFAICLVKTSKSYDGRRTARITDIQEDLISPSP
jgi:hypothetical protein